MRTAALCLLLVTGAALHGAAPSSAAPTQVMLKVSGTAHGPNIRMGDVVEGLPAEASQLGVKASGMPGNHVTVDAALVALKLQRAPGGPYALSGPRHCEVSVGKQVLRGDDIRRFTQDYLEKRLSGTANAELKPLGMVADLPLYDAPVRLKVDPLEDAQLRGNLVLMVRVLQDDDKGAEREAASVPVSYLIKRQESRLVAIKVIRRGDVLGPENLALRDGDATFDERGFDSLGAVEGKVARAYVGVGKVLARSMVEFPALVKRGDIVRVVVHSGGVMIDATGKAMRDAREGEMIPVLMTDTRKELQARCVETGVVVYEAR